MEQHLIIVIQQNQWKAENKEVMFTCVERILYTMPPANQRPVSQLTNQPTKQKSNQTKKNLLRKKTKAFFNPTKTEQLFDSRYTDY